jgi:hypothetical protein
VRLALAEIIERREIEAMAPTAGAPTTGGEKSAIGFIHRIVLN